MIDLDLKREATTAKVWTELNKVGFVAKDGPKWNCQRFAEPELKAIEYLVGCLKHSIIVRADGPKLMTLQTELANIGVHCLTPLEPNNYHLNVMVIWCCF